MFGKGSFSPREYAMELYQTGQLFAEPRDTDILVLVLIRVFVALAILFIAHGVVRWLRGAIKRGLTVVAGRAATEQRRLTTLYGVLASALGYVIYFVAALLVLFTFGVTWKVLAPLLGLASVIGLAIGFGAQRLVRDVITGLFILGEGQYDVGDRVTIGTVTGRVTDIGLRVTRICDEQGRSVVLANGDITLVFNASRGLIMSTIDFSIPRSASLEETLSLVREVATRILEAQQLSSDHPDKAPVVAVTGASAERITARLTAWAPVTARSEFDRYVRRQLVETLPHVEIQS